MISFTKMHGIGNDFVLVNGFSQSVPEASLRDLSRLMCDRRFGIGSDGLILAEQGIELPFRMRMFNPDGSESEMCGNGIRCVAKFVHDEGLTQLDTIPIETGAGPLTLELTDGGMVRVDMGPARLLRGEIGMAGSPGEMFIGEPVGFADLQMRGTAVSMGNPHLVLFVDDVDAIDLKSVGSQLEHHPLFPQRVNVHFVELLSRSHIKQRTWERGAGATLACGTGACASAVAAFVNGLAERSLRVTLPGGDLLVEYSENGKVFMTGPAETVFKGNWPD